MKKAVEPAPRPASMPISESPRVESLTGEQYNHLEGFDPLSAYLKSL